MYTHDDRIFSGSRQEVRLHGINWFGFNNNGGAPNGLWTGQPMASDFATVVARLRCLGFNAVRLPFSFKDLDPAKGTAPDFTFDTGTVPTPAQIAESCGLAGNSAAIARATLPYKPARQGTRCNGYLSGQTVWQRYVYVVQFFARNGFFVLADNHLREDDTAIRDNRAWVGAWIKLAAELCQDGSTKSRLMLDLLNEPDQYGLRWEPGANSLTQLYLTAMDAIEKVAPVMYMVEGAGQGGINANWGDGFCTDADLIAKHGLSDPRPFFDAVATKPYATRVMLAPHVYGPAVTTNDKGSQGAELTARLTQSFGGLTSKGYKGRRYAVAIGETGSKFTDPRDQATMRSFADYMLCRGAGDDQAHHPIRNFFYWSWNPNSGDTGGLVGDDWVTLQKDKLAWLRQVGL